MNTRPTPNPRLTIDTHTSHVERIAWLHSLPVEADATHEFVTFAGITYRAELIPVGAR